jgi:hypothetical protein
VALPPSSGLNIEKRGNSAWGPKIRDIARFSRNKIADLEFIGHRT